MQMVIFTLSRSNVLVREGRNVDSKSIINSDIDMFDNALPSRVLFDKLAYQ
jgi:hypothetical protein